MYELRVRKSVNGYGVCIGCGHIYKGFTYEKLKNNSNNVEKHWSGSTCKSARAAKPSGGFSFSNWKLEESADSGKRRRTNPTQDGIGGGGTGSNSGVAPPSTAAGEAGGSSGGSPRDVETSNAAVAVAADTLMTSVLGSDEEDAADEDYCEGGEEDEDDEEEEDIVDVDAADPAPVSSEGGTCSANGKLRMCRGIKPLLGPATPLDYPYGSHSLSKFAWSCDSRGLVRSDECVGIKEDGKHACRYCLDLDSNTKLRNVLIRAAKPYNEHHVSTTSHDHLTLRQLADRSKALVKAASVNRLEAAKQQQRKQRLLKRQDDSGKLLMMLSQNNIAGARGILAASFKNKRSISHTMRILEKAAAGLYRCRNQYNERDKDVALLMLKIGGRALLRMAGATLGAC
jgi:hypothetical protein